MDRFGDQFPFVQMCSANISDVRTVAAASAAASAAAAAAVSMTDQQRTG